MEIADAPIFKGLTDEQTLALVTYGEARGESTEGKIAVAWVVINRANTGGWFGNTIKEAAYKKSQFSCFNTSDPNYAELKRIASNFNLELTKNKVLASCYTIAKGCLSGSIGSNVSDATFYHTTKVRPAWTKVCKFITQIENHRFYNKEV